MALFMTFLVLFGLKNLHVFGVTCHMSCVTCHISHVMCHMSHVTLLSHSNRPFPADSLLAASLGCAKVLQLNE